MLNQDLRRSSINTHKTKIFGWLYYPFRVLISNIMECHLRVLPIKYKILFLSMQLASVNAKLRFEEISQ
jgi:hypothetical protein